MRDGRFDSYDGNNGRWQTGIPATTGMSGGPVTDADGRVVAIVEGGDPSGVRTTVTPIAWAHGVTDQSEVEFVDCSAAPRAAAGSSGPNCPIRGYARTADLARVSPEMGGGFSQTRWCDQALATLRTEQPGAHFTVLSSSETSRSTCMPFNCPQYQYTCQIRVETEPIYETALGCQQRQ